MDVMERTAFTCERCGHGQRGDRGLHQHRLKVRGLDDDPAEVKAAKQRDLDDGKQWDGRTFVEVVKGQAPACPVCPTIDAANDDPLVKLAKTFTPDELEKIKAAFAPSKKKREE